jgi:hypothetical protein
LEEKGERSGGFLAKPPFPSPSSIQNRDGGEAALGRPVAAIADEPGHGSGREVGGNGEGDAGD